MSFMVGGEVSGHSLLPHCLGWGAQAGIPIAVASRQVVRGQPWEACVGVRMGNGGGREVRLWVSLMTAVGLKSEGLAF
jgi:hypothetical protein